MLLPYYVASMNIEHAYYEATGKYEPFEGICLVDTFQTVNGKMSYFADGERHEQQDMAIEFNPENRMDDEQYIVRLIGQVITVSLETQKVIGTLPEVKAP